MDAFELSQFRHLTLSGPARSRRLASHLTLAELAREVGVDPSTVYRWERGSESLVVSRPSATPRRSIVSLGTRSRLMSFDEPLAIDVPTRLLGISRNVAYQEARRYLESGGTEGLPAVRLGRRVLCPVQVLRDWLGVEPPKP